MNISYSRKAVKQIEALDRTAKQRIRKAIEKLPKGDVKPLTGSDGLYRLRIGGWRVVFSYPAKGNVLIEKIAPRGKAYKGGLP